MSNIAMDIYCILEKGIKDINMLSGGEKQKIEFVKTILKEAKVYIYDEPTAHLDQESKQEYYNYLEQQKEKIVIMISHNNQEEKYIDEIYEVASNKNIISKKQF